MPSTLRLRADSAADIEVAAEIIRAGGTVAFPTETVYGLGANALDSRAVLKIFEAKLRPAWDPLIVHVADTGQLQALTSISVETQQRVSLLAAQFWPGPLTLLLPRTEAISGAVTAGRPLVGMRVPSHPAALAFLRSAGVPVAAPSANTFGHTSPTTADHVLADLDGRIDAVMDGGPTTVGVESTVIDPTQTPVILYRPGAITRQQISTALGVQVVVFESNASTSSSEPDSLPSPGVGIRHYAPCAQVILVEGGEAALQQALRTIKGPGILLPQGWSASGDSVAEPWGRWDEPAKLAATLFAGLRALDDRGVRVIFCPLPPAGGLNDAIRDRLMKAARSE